MEVVDGWLVKLYPKVPTWGEIADVVEKIGHDNLAHSIRQVYITGEQTKCIVHVCETSISNLGNRNGICSYLWFRKQCFESKSIEQSFV